MYSMTLAGGGATVLEEQGRDLVYSCTLRTACHLAAVGGAKTSSGPGP